MKMLIVDIFPSILSTEKNIQIKLLHLQRKKIEDTTVHAGYFFRELLLNVIYFSVFLLFIRKLNLSALTEESD